MRHGAAAALTDEDTRRLYDLIDCDYLDGVAVPRGAADTDDDASVTLDVAVAVGDCRCEHRYAFADAAKHLCRYAFADAAMRLCRYAFADAAVYT